MVNPVNARLSRGRVYKHPITGEEATSVTTFIGDGFPKPRLMGWAGRTVAEYAFDHSSLIAGMVEAAGDDAEARAAVVKLIGGAPYRKRNKAGDVGTQVHEWIESLANGDPAPTGEPAPHIEHFLRFVDEWHPRFDMAEATVWNRTLGYAGTLDWVAGIPGLGHVLGDTKTGGVYPEVALQLAAYRFAEFVLEDDGIEGPMPQIDCCVVLHLQADGYELIPVQADEAALAGFLHVANTARWIDSASRLIGKPLVATVAERSLAAKLREVS